MATWPQAHDFVPEGTWRLDVREAWTNGKELIVLGEPGFDEDAEPENDHDCDLMGCSSFGWHVLARGDIRVCDPAPPKQD